MVTRKTLRLGLLLALMLLATGSCRTLSPAQPASSSTATAAQGAVAATPQPMASPSPPIAPSATSPAVPSPAATLPPAATPFTFGALPDCGRTLPLLPGDAPRVTEVRPDTAALEEALALAPDEARPALEYLLRAPGSVGLAAYRVGDEENGAYLNGDVPLPLASVVKLIHLVAYAEAVSAGELTPTATVSVSDLERYYLPTLDLRAHRQALEALEADGRLFGQPQALLLDEVARMMIEFSSNAATDYLHMLLGQDKIEATVQELQLGDHSAPCPFVGQFLSMANHTRPEVEGLAAVQGYLADPARYGHEVVQYTAAFSQDEGFRGEAIAWRRATRRPTVFTQRLFGEQLHTHGTAVAYASLMARLAQNGLGSGESSFLARRHLEWPMRFPSNQERFNNLGYKGGSLPGVLTSAYYAYPLGADTPVVVALFFHELPDNTYRRWQRTQAHDELARWLLYEPEAIPVLRALLQGSPN